MAKSQIRSNPFYVLLVVAGVLFTITAAAYGVMAFREVSPNARPLEPGASLALMTFLDQYGMAILGGELVVLAIACFAAMGLDQHFSPSHTTKASSQSTPLTAPLDKASDPSQ